MQAKLKRFRDYKVLLHTAQAIEKNFCCCFNRKKLAFSLLQYYDAAVKTAKKALTQADRAFGLNNFTIWSLKLTLMFSNLRTNQKQMKLKIGKKLRATSLNSKFTSSYEKSVIRVK